MPADPRPARRGAARGVAELLHPRVALPGPEHFGRIDPVPAGAPRPFWSVMIPTYNRARYLEEALRSVLAQDPGPGRMQVEVVDNASAGGEIEEIVRRVGGGRVGFFRQPGNVPLHENWNTCIRRARGHWVHLLHDDDAVLPGFYEGYERLIGAHPEATLAAGPAIHIDEDGVRSGVSPALVEEDGPIPGFRERQTVRNDLRTPAVVVARRAYEEAGGVCDLLHHTADWELFFRAGWVGQAVATREARALYRLHAGMDTNHAVLSGANVREYVRAVEFCFARLSPEEQAEVGPKRYAAVAALARGYAGSLAEEGEFRASLRQAAWEFRLAPSGRALARLGFAASRCLLRSGAPERWVRRLRPPG